MKKLSEKNRIASIQAKLLNEAKRLKLDVNIIRIRYTLERLLYRLGISKYREKLTLKGAMLFLIWSNEVYRPTKDIDLLLSGKSDQATVSNIFKSITSLNVPEDDGMIYDSNSISTEIIKEDQSYSGVN